MDFNVSSRGEANKERDEFDSDELKKIQQSFADALSKSLRRGRRRRLQAKPLSTLPLFAAPAASTQPFSEDRATAIVSPLAHRLLARYQEFWALSGECHSSANHLAEALGLGDGPSAKSAIQRARLELLNAGLLVVGRPTGLAPQVRPIRWRCTACQPMPTSQRIAAVTDQLAAAASDLSALIHIHSELSEESSAERTAGALAAVRQALACLEKAGPE